jgi:FkbM family methyltransferase
MKDFLESCGIPFEGDFIKLPSWCKRVKIDVGLSECAPQSEVWLQREDDLVVFGFEPVTRNIELIKNGQSKFFPILKSERIGSSFFLIPCALGNVAEPQKVPFYVTSKDSGCSSYLEPTTFDVSHVENVSLYSLSHFLKYFPFHQIDHIDYMKTDCQGADLDVLKGAGEYLKKICVITSEPEVSQYKNAVNSMSDITNHLHKLQFIQIASSSVDDPTYLNIHLKHIPVQFYQKG